VKSTENTLNDTLAVVAPYEPPVTVTSYVPAFPFAAFDNVPAEIIESVPEVSPARFTPLKRH
jgi:hypothetical protein